MSDIQFVRMANRLRSNRNRFENCPARSVFIFAKSFAQSVYYPDSLIDPGGSKMVPIKT